MKINILQLHSSSGLYGAETVILSLSKALKQTKYNPIIGCLMPDNGDKPQLGKEAEAFGLDVIYFQMKIKFNPFVVREIGKVINQRNIQIMHAHGYKSNILGVIASKIYNVPIITTNHLFPPMPLNNKNYNFFQNRCIFCNEALR